MSAIIASNLNLNVVKMYMTVHISSDPIFPIWYT